jgi:hypothetical protein
MIEQSGEWLRANNRRKPDLIGQINVSRSQGCDVETATVVEEPIA